MAEENPPRSAPETGKQSRPVPMPPRQIHPRECHRRRPSLASRDYTAVDAGIRKRRRNLIILVVIAVLIVAGVLLVALPEQLRVHR